MSRRTCVLALLPALLAACGHDPAATPRVVAFLGDSITYGTVRAGPHGAGRDPAGGYPGRLQRLLGPRARVLNRGVGGATAGFWLLDAPPTGEPPPGARSLALAVLGRDRPDVVVILLGVNDLSMEWRRRGDAVVDVALERLEKLRGQLASIAPTVLLATPLPNHRDPAALVDALARGIRAAHPDALPLGERFTAAGWEHLLSDEVHPNEEGYELLARAVADELQRRGLVDSAPRS